MTRRYEFSRVEGGGCRGLRQVLSKIAIKTQKNANKNREKTSEPYVTGRGVKPFVTKRYVIIEWSLKIIQEF